jgi:CBS domain-containing protein
VNQVAQILEEKGHDVLQIEADASVFEAVKQMVAANVASLLVKEGGEITGIITERDYLRRVTAEGRTDEGTSVREIMSSPLIVVTPQTSIDECMALMTDRRIRRLPVVDTQAGWWASSRSGTSSSSRRSSRASRSSSCTSTSARARPSADSRPRAGYAWIALGLPPEQPSNDGAEGLDRRAASVVECRGHD